MAVFDNVSGNYKQVSLVQSAAADKLIGLLALNGKEDILDVGCGPGHITARIKEKTSGRVEGTDISAGMVEQARKAFPLIRFVAVPAEDMDYQSEFDLVFCNSSFQWFPDPGKALASMYKALRSGGRIGLAQPATRTWSSCFLTVANEAGGKKDTAEFFSKWKSPWNFLEDEKAYEDLFSKAGLRTLHISIEHESTAYPAEKALANFFSGAGQGYLDPKHYEGAISEDYFVRFKKNAREAMIRLGENGVVEVDFNRLYYVGVKS